MKSQIIIFQSEDKNISVDVLFDNETVWLNLDQIASLFEKNKSTISRHIKNIFDEGELEPNSTVANFATVQNEGGREVKRNVDFYNLDIIISVGYRVKSLRGTQFRKWATKHLNEFEIYRANEMKNLQSDFDKSIKKLKKDTNEPN